MVSLVFFFFFFSGVAPCLFPCSETTVSNERCLGRTSTRSVSGPVRAPENDFKSRNQSSKNLLLLGVGPSFTWGFGLLFRWGFTLGLVLSGFRLSCKFTFHFFLGLRGRSTPFRFYGSDLGLLPYWGFVLGLLLSKWVYSF